MDKFALIGEKLGHSFSKDFFTQKFKKESIKAVYVNKEFNDISEVVTLKNEADLKGFNVTIPFKESIIPYLDFVSAEAQQIGAVNTVKIENNKWIGYNTDVFGFKQSIKPFFKSQHEKAMILGTGGASKAVAFVLEEIGAEVIYISRDPKGEFEFGYNEVSEHMIDACKIIVNTTPVGTFPSINDTINIPYGFFTPKHLVIDLIYNPPKTKFLEKAEVQGAWILNGKTMLEQQAEEAWRIWNS